MKLSMTVVAMNTGIAGRLTFGFSATAIQLPADIHTSVSGGTILGLLSAALAQERNMKATVATRIQATRSDNTVPRSSNSSSIGTNRTLKSHKEDIKNS